MFGADIVRARNVMVMGNNVTVKIFMRHNGRYFAVTSFSERDIIITDGVSAEETLKHHTSILPLAISCRRARSENCRESTQSIASAGTVKFPVFIIGFVVAAAVRSKLPKFIRFGARLTAWRNGVWWLFSS
ncbi:MAG: hypothetical protein P4L44_09090 [Oryzomonas sp.]|uniref:hypothetical protein n=1 Tax=Oryzomonas sp. TaxID=2855186 RepID=UPI00283B7A4E|nr:hypothetical protein [Oryzomonas sp.]MDR3580103.1 hypothetical protein [Oryzomonas sp.]